MKAKAQDHRVMPKEQMPEEVQRIGEALAKCMHIIEGMYVGEVIHVIANMQIMVGMNLQPDTPEACAETDHRISTMVFLARCDQYDLEQLDRYQSERSSQTGKFPISHASYDTPENAAQRNNKPNT